MRYALVACFFSFLCRCLLLFYSCAVDDMMLDSCESML